MADPSYLQMDRPQLNHRIEQAQELLRSPCRVCPRGCKVDRTKDDHRGYCGVGAKALVAGSVAIPVEGSGPLIRGTPGAGELVFASCNLRCVYCIAWRQSQERQGAELSSEQLARMMLNLQEAGAVNISLLTPNMCGPQLLAALPYAIDHGLRLPLFYGTSCYDSLEMLRLLDGIVDVYGATVKYSDDTTGARFSGVSDYWSVAKAALKEMHRQVGVLDVKESMPVRGLIVNYLVLPNGIAGTAKAMCFLARELSVDTPVAFMLNYCPLYRASDYPELARRITGREYVRAVKAARKAGLRRLPGTGKRLAWIKQNPWINEIPAPYTVLPEDDGQGIVAMFLQQGLREVLWEDDGKEDTADGQGASETAAATVGSAGKATC